MASYILRVVVISHSIDTNGRPGGMWAYRAPLLICVDITCVCAVT